jgi:hypothetical protein
MSPDLKSVDNQDISNHRQDHPYYQKILTTSLSFRWFLFSLIYMEINLKRMDVTKFFAGFISIASPTEWSLSFLVPLTNLKLYPEEL